MFLWHSGEAFPSACAEAVSAPVCACLRCALPVSPQPPLEVPGTNQLKKGHFESERFSQVSTAFSCHPVGIHMGSKSKVRSQASPRYF